MADASTQESHEGLRKGRQAGCSIGTFTRRRSPVQSLVGLPLDRTQGLTMVSDSSEISRRSHAGASARNPAGGGGSGSQGKVSAGTSTPKAWPWYAEAGRKGRLGARSSRASLHRWQSQILLS